MDRYDRTRLVSALGKAEGMRDAFRFHPDRDDPFMSFAITLLDDLAADIAAGLGLRPSPSTEETTS